MRKINEIFYSLQGEGFHTGTPAVFIRFSGCNLKCSFCDTRHEDGTLMSDEEILQAVSAYPSNVVILTGGEPSLWIDQAFIDLLHQAGKYICIETNGTNPLPEGIDWVTCSPKGAPLRLTHIDEIKVVYTGQDLTAYANQEASWHFLQPCSCQNTKEVVEYILHHPLWRLSLQTHKLIDIN
ncbi:radical SAM protein [Parabacteroides sp. AF17-28]|uniref:7-carboxy-7-deazaguanine synthase QueE n=1 Tax=Parabacteroides sp. AF17-28 TaxID=2292241 RepID=UPI000EFE29B8|nr:radical SAM protein [Parabacteroides sp. AF17-28]RHR61745.1 radical SAM protein [Parabacteroides sp. AF17-28]